MTAIVPQTIAARVTLLAASIIGVFSALFLPFAAEQNLMLGITIFCIILWIGTPVPPWFTGLAGIGMIGIAFSPDLALGGFAEPVLWLIVFGLVMGEAIHRAGVAKTLEYHLLGWIAPDILRAERANPVKLFRRLLVVLSLGGLVFAVMVPSSLVRILVMAPILIGIGTVFESRSARLGILFGPLFSTFFGSVGILTAFLPNIVTTGILESTTGETISWTAWILTMFPFMGIGRVLLIIGIVYVLYRPASDSGVDITPAEYRPDTTSVRRTGVILLVGVAIWATDFIHGLHPVFGALVVAMLLLLPYVGTVDFDTVEDVDFSIVFFIGAVFAIAAGLTETGFTDVAGTALLDMVPPDATPAVVLGAVFVITLLLMLLLEGIAAASVLTPVLISFAAGAGIPPSLIVQIEAMALGHFFFPYQSIALVAMLSYKPISSRELIRITSLITIGSILLLVPLQIGFLLYLQ